MSIVMINWVTCRKHVTIYLSCKMSVQLDGLLKHSIDEIKLHFICSIWLMIVSFIKWLLLNDSLGSNL